MHYSTLLIFLTALCSGLPLTGQHDIRLKNPSFEDKPAMSEVPSSWKNCGFPGESAPDIQPCGAFEVTTLPSNGNTYLGLVTRDNDTWEKVGARVSQKMEAGVVYEFKIQLCRAAQYKSYSRLTNEPVNFNKPVVFRIFGGNSYCEKEQLLGVSPPVEHIEWATYRFTLSPQAKYSHILIEAYYADPRGIAYCGNLLVDNASELVPLGVSDRIDKASMIGEKISNP